MPFAFQGKIKEMVRHFVNDNINAHVEFNDVSLSFFKDFPYAEIDIYDLSIVNNTPFKGETLASVGQIALSVSVKELLKTEEDTPIAFKKIYVDDALVTLRKNTLGDVNYDISKAKHSESQSSALSDENENSCSFKLNLKDYRIRNSAFTYTDESSKMSVNITEFNHEGHATVSETTSELDTNTQGNFTLIVNDINYLNNNTIKLDANIGLDLENNTYTFKENKAYINALPLHFDGFVKLLNKGQQVDITIDNPESSFKSFLALIPKPYSGSLEHVETSGDFNVQGYVKGLFSEETFPKMDVQLISNNAAFKYADLPKKVEDIKINTVIKNTTGFLKDTYIDVKTLNFKIDEDVFKSSIRVKNITENALVDANIDGVLNLDNLEKAYPLDLEHELSGVLEAHLKTHFDMNAVEKSAYERIDNNGEIHLKDFKLFSKDFSNPIDISKADIIFNTNDIKLNRFNASTGISDVSASGSIENLLNFILNDGKLKGDFTVNSNTFKVSDFMMAEEITSSENASETVSDTTLVATETLKIPDFLDCKIKANAKQVLYDNLELKNVKGLLTVKDQKVTLKDVSSDVFDGLLSMSGQVSTQNDTPTFNFDFGADAIDISKSFETLALFKNIAPIAELLKGKLNTTIGLSGDLTSDFLPDLNSVSGDVLAEVLTSTIDAKKAGVLNELQSSMNFIDFNKLNLKDLKTKLEFKDGSVSVKPFDVNYEDITMRISGGHNFNNTLNYSAIIDVPAKYLGSDVNRLIGKIDSDDVNNIAIPVTANIGGSYTKPSVKTDLINSTKTLVTKLVEIQKQKLINNGKNKVTDLLSDVITPKKGDTNKTSSVIKDIIKGSGENNKANTTTPVEKKVKDVLGGLFGKKKK